MLGFSFVVSRFQATLERFHLCFVDSLLYALMRTCRHAHLFTLNLKSLALNQSNTSESVYKCAEQMALIRIERLARFLLSDLDVPIAS